METKNQNILVLVEVLYRTFLILCPVCCCWQGENIFTNLKKIQLSATKKKVGKLWQAHGKQIWDVMNVAELLLQLRPQCHLPGFDTDSV